MDSSHPTPRELFPNARFAPPATEEQIAAVEAQLGIRLPDPLRRVYLDCDGFREDRGNAKYLLSLTDKDVIGSLVTMTRFWWEEYPKQGPPVDLRPFIFFGCSGGDDWWGIDWKNGRTIIAYHHSMHNQYEIVGTHIAEVWRADYASYDEIGEL